MIGDPNWSVGSPGPTSGRTSLGNGERIAAHWARDRFMDFSVGYGDKAMLIMDADRPHAGQNSDGQVAIKRSGRFRLPEAPRRLLVADDEHLVASGIASALTELGLDVIGPATDGDQAVMLCEQQLPDMALLDVEMPKRNGIAVAEDVYQRFGIPVMIFSAYSDAEYVSGGTKAGVFGYLLKPVTQDQLRVGITVAWGRFRDVCTKDNEINDLQRRLEERRIIEQAKWIIVQHQQIAEPMAHQMLQRQARNNRRSLIDVARSVINDKSLLTDPAEPGSD